MQISSSTSNELIQVDTHEFLFPLERDKVEFFLRIINITSDYVAFYMTYTLATVKQYQKTPNKGILSPGSMVVIDMTRLNPTAPQAAVVANEAVYVNSTVVSKHFKTSAITYDLFNKPETGRLVHKMTLPVTLAATSGPQSWEVTTSLSLLDQQVSSPV